ncbi:MAG: hypothetical protein LBS72_03350 [Oscillospiraceae bacterium]|jgi:hypothetical protein|nr:hypothetical protein [Oscillospiraceae bacterium]
MRPKKNKLNGLDALAKHSDLYKSDVMGGYTGTPADADDPEPEQDADDL